MNDVDSDLETRKVISDIFLYPMIFVTKGIILKKVE